MGRHRKIESHAFIIISAAEKVFYSKRRKIYFVVVVGGGVFVKLRSVEAHWHYKVKKNDH